MKKIFLTAGILVMASAVTFAHTTSNRKERKEARIEKKEARKEFRIVRRAENRNEVSDFTKIRFAKDFPEAKNVRYAKTENFDEVYFTSGKKMLQAYYDYNSNLVGTTKKKTFADLPEIAQKKIMKDYAGYTIDGVIKFDDNENNDSDMIMYGSSFDDADNYFVELKNAGRAIVLKVDEAGDVSYFTTMR